MYGFLKDVLPLRCTYMHHLHHLNLIFVDGIKCLIKYTDTVTTSLYILGTGCNNKQFSNLN